LHTCPSEVSRKRVTSSITLQRFALKPKLIKALKVLQSNAFKGFIVVRLIDNCCKIATPQKLNSDRHFITKNRDRLFTKNQTAIAPISPRNFRLNRRVVDV